MLSCTRNHRGSRLHPNSNRSLPAKTCFTNNETILYGTHPTNDISHELAKLAHIHHLTMQTRIVILQLLYFVLRFGLTSIFHTRCISDPKAERIFISYSNGEILLEIALLVGCLGEWAATYCNRIEWSGPPCGVECRYFFCLKHQNIWNIG